MHIENLTVRARLRAPWESIDLGTALARQYWLPLFLVWLLPAALLLASLAWLLPEHPGWSLFAVWWLKPVFDRLPLFMISRALFGAPVSALAALKQFFAQNRRDWLAWITLRRLNPTRSFDMPVTVLEQSSGAVRSARLGVLHRKHASAATWLTLTGIHLEGLFLIAAFILIYLFIPEQVAANIDWLPILRNDTLGLEWLSNVLYLFIMAAVAPFYIVSGFCLYIGRRIELEGWDIEIQFRDLAERHQRKQQPRRGVAGGSGTVSLLLLFALFFSPLAPAPESRADALETPQQAQQHIDEILAGEDFHQIEQINGWRLKGWESQEQKIPEWLIQFIEWLFNRSFDTDDASDSNWGAVIAGLIEILLWIGVIAGLIYLGWRHHDTILKHLRWQPRSKPKAAVPETLFGLDIRQSSLPDDVCAEVQRLWQAGEKRASLSLLYRATLSHLIEDFQFQFGDHLTESECARLVHRRQQEPAEHLPPVTVPLSRFVQQLTTDWQQLAYAHRNPIDARIHALCQKWQEVFRNDR
ncbi:hypothetical protein [Microbulbifer sp. 2205BS26-8]|uniref:hypothetical protein n=1 Tax=Microbulbifer sp. 2205BS26-8 TaxID=3064386 RepID=UPI00273DEB5A|nr:hypothetical protein [Microbulbifer sp. 2205BS26-8]MDP5209672.1 hypothetical protein [Microbulbifer sp. 2205BS26-8]